MHLQASVTVYNTNPYSMTLTASAANYTAPAYSDTSNLTAPTLPNPLPSTNFALQVGASNTSQGGLSIPIPGTFYGFSVEMSVANQVPFLNLMSLLKARAGGVHIRVGGNTQETATMVPFLPNGTILQKAELGNDTTQTPALFISPEMLYMLNNISSLVEGVKWYLGIPMNDTNNLRLGIAEYGEAIMGDNLLGFQVGNEPDMYGTHRFGGRPTDYSPQDYFTEFGQVMTGINNDPNIPIKNNIVGPSVTGAFWSPDQVFATGYLTAYASNLAFISVEKYPDTNCGVMYPSADDPIQNPQTVFPQYLNHTAGTSIIAQFINCSREAQAIGKPMLMFETNTASCGGFPGISNSYGSALWGMDYGLTMAASNFSGAMFHVSGADVYYNPFTPPPANQTHIHQWTVSPLFYANLIVAEALGPTNTAQVVDLQANSGSEFTPAYAIYENGVPARMALFNYNTDLTGASTYTANIGVNSGTLSSVQVKYLSAPSTAERYNITWAGQDFGLPFQSDGRLQGDLNVETIQCSNNQCQVQVPAPGFALVFLTTKAFSEVNPAPSAVPTFSTTTLRYKAVPTVAQSVLATSNGHGGKGGQVALGSTSEEHSASDAAQAVALPLMTVLMAVMVGTSLILQRTFI
ncbi:hypothetical protein HWV62_34531 [Athelia sp. TMB]|nr:hypothetical protein HWV62_34531 [Athelia sp. TMB]